MTINKFLLSTAFLVTGISNAFAISTEEAVNKNLWLNTGGSRGALPGNQPKNPEPFRYQYNNSLWDDFEYECEGGNDDTSEWTFFTEAEITSVSPTKNMLYDTSADMVGANLKFGANQTLSESFSYDLYLFNGYSFGESEYLCEDRFWTYWSEYGVLFAEISFGANIRWHISNNFSIYAGARIGGGMLYIEDANYDSEAGLGLAYGFSAGGQWSFNKHHAITFGYSFVGSTAESEINTFANHSITVGKQSFNTFSFGYKYTF